MKKFYRDCYGSTASIMKHRDDSATLIICTGQGNQIIRRTYDTERGARIAMGMYSDSWREQKKGA